MLPLSRAELPALAAQTRTRPEDTQLNEQLITMPDGGDHFWLKVQCIGLGHRQAVAAIARAAGVEPHLVASAGSRDRHAVVQQWMTVPKAPIDNPKQLKGAGYKRQLRVLKCVKGTGRLPRSTSQVSTANLNLTQQVAPMIIKWPKIY